MSNNKHSVYGLHAVRQLMETHPERIKTLWIAQGRSDKAVEALLKLADAQGISVQKVAKSKLDQEAPGVHQGVLALCSAAVTLTEADLDRLLDDIDGDPLILVLDGVTDPHNLGACMRTADAAGVHFIIAPKDKSAPLNATAAKVACGAVNTVDYVRVTNLARALEQLKQRGIWIAGTAGEAQKSIYEQSLTGPLALVMGAEGQGLRRLTKSLCDYLIHIPMAGKISSLNVSVATGVGLFEIARQKIANKKVANKKVANKK